MKQNKIIKTKEKIKIKEKNIKIKKKNIKIKEKENGITKEEENGITKEEENRITKEELEEITKEERIIKINIAKGLNKSKQILILKNKEHKNKEPNIIYNPNVILYILCHNEEIYKECSDKFKKFYWAKPILMKYQDISFENSFWKQLLEIKDEWINCDMVGTLSSSFDKKYDPINIDNIIIYKIYNSEFHPFLKGKNLVLKGTVNQKHKLFKTIWNDILNELNFNDCYETFCNYWMCKPENMLMFIDWYLVKAYNIVSKHKLIWEDSEYKKYQNKDILIKLWNKEFYPYLPFILERLNPCFFYNNFKF
jgi:hypothetical protein